MAAAVTHTIAGIAPGHRPTAAKVRAFEASWHAAARSMPSHRGGSHRGGGILGYVGSVMPATQYLAIPNTVAWIDPAPPVQPLVIPNNTSAALTSVMLHQHTTDLEELSQFVINMNTLRSLFLDNIDNVLIGHLRDRLLNFVGVHPRDMVQHLIVTYAIVIADELEENATAFRAPWDPSQPIEGRWACQGHDDISWPTVVRTTVGILEAYTIQASAAAVCRAIFFYVFISPLEHFYFGATFTTSSLIIIL